MQDQGHLGLINFVVQSVSYHHLLHQHLLHRHHLCGHLVGFVGLHVNQHHLYFQNHQASLLVIHLVLNQLGDLPFVYSFQSSVLHPLMDLN